MARRLVACLLSVSEARDLKVVEKIALAAISNNQGQTDNKSGFPIKSTVLNIFSDHDYNRSVITIAATADNIASSVFDACCKGYELIDLSKQEGGHPRLGSVDFVPLHPISEDLTLEECGKIARDIAFKLAENVPGSSSFLFGHADIPECRGLVNRRKVVKWYDGKHGMDYSQLKQDVGPIPTARYGMTGIGSIPYVMNCNVTIASQDLEFGNKIAHAIRATTKGGLPGVQSMAFHHEGNIEIACNVQSFTKEEATESSTDFSKLISSFGKFYHIPPDLLEGRVKSMAREQGIATVGTAIIGFTPEAAGHLATKALESGQAEYWRTRKVRMM